MFATVDRHVAQKVQKKTCKVGQRFKKKALVRIMDNELTKRIIFARRHVIKLKLNAFYDSWLNYSANTLLRRVEFGIWLKHRMCICISTINITQHHRKIWNLTRRSRSLLLREWRSQIEYLFDLHFLLVLGQKWTASEYFWDRLCVCVFAYLRKHFQIQISQGFQSNFLMEAATLHILLQTNQKMGIRQEDRQKGKDKHTNT